MDLSVAEAASPLAASFRDPHGFVFLRDGVVLRQVNESARADFDLLLSSGLYDALSGSGDLIRHEELDPVLMAATSGAYRVLRPEQVPFISYPYEWSFSQLKDAALLTLRLQAAAIRHGLSLRDATAYNVQFHDGRPVWIDTLSFERHEPGRPWVAYRQFCELFLAPLALMAHGDIRLQHLLRAYIDGVPLDLASRLLPWRTRLVPGLLVHLHLHAAAQRRTASKPAAPPPRKTMSATAAEALLDSLERTVRALDWRPAGTVWGDYYDATNYTDTAFAHKRELVARALDRFTPSVVWDLGANDGTFGMLASQRGARTIAFDVDPAAVEKNYRRIRQQDDRLTLPLLLDLTNPSPPCGWAGRERLGLDERGPADLVLALALAHHLAIAHNVPLPRVAEYFASLGRALVIEFVPKDDTQVRRMLASREDIFPAYTRQGFEAAFDRFFEILDAEDVRESRRTIYSMRRRAA